MEEINWQIPRISDDPIELTLRSGNPLFIVGPNGSGKSALIQQFVSENRVTNKIERIAAHRQTWLDSGSTSFTPANRQQYDRNTQDYDTNVEARWRDFRGSEGLSVVLFDLFAKENAINKSIAHHVRNQDTGQALEFSAESPSPFDQINELLARGGLPVTINNPDDQNLLARHPQGDAFSIAEMSDGERNAMIIAAHVITAEPGTVLLIDEPERHLHRSIIQPFLSALFALRREDCTFIIATHEMTLPATNPEARVLMLRSCQWSNRECVAWEAQVLEPDSELPEELRLPEDLKLAILGSRKRILFVEGQPGSLDFSLYTALFPSISVVPKGSCEEVRRAIDGLRESHNFHYVKAFGIIDRDNRTDEDVEKLAEKDVFALEVYSVEALYYCSDAIAAVAHRQADSLGVDATELIKSAKQKAIDGLKVEAEKTPERMASLRCERQIRERVLLAIPDKQSIMDNPTRPICVSIDPVPYSEELDHFNKLVEEEKLDRLIARYSLRKSRTFEIIATTLRCRDQKDYERMVLTQIQKDNQLALALKGRMRPLSETLDSVENR